MTTPTATPTRAARTRGRGRGILTPALYLLATVRILIGFEFLWAFVDKAFGLGRNTPAEEAWTAGGSPTYGYLSAERALQDLFQPLAGVWIVDWLFMIGLLAVGIGLMAGIAMRASAVAGSLMLLFMWLAAFPIATNPFVNYNLTNALVVLALFFLVGHMRLSLAGPWQRMTERLVGPKGAEWLK